MTEDWEKDEVGLGRRLRYCKCFEVREQRMQSDEWPQVPVVRSGGGQVQMRTLNYDRTALPEF